MTKKEGDVKLDFSLELVQRETIASFITHWHYSHNINGVISNYCFALKDGNELIGAMIYGRMAMPGQSKKYGETEEVLELRRLCCVDDTPRNTESYFIGKTLRWLRKNTKIKTIISYADSNYNHTGIIYKASNFKFLGMTAPGRVIVYKNRVYHDKTIRTKYNGVLKPFALEIKNALVSGDAFYKKSTGKYIYSYNLRGN